MTQQLHMLVGADEAQALPEVRKITIGDLKDALAKGIDDFWAMPTHVIFLSGIYAVLGIILARVSFDTADRVRPPFKRR
jgi:uncharacterized membrane protein